MIYRHLGTSLWRVSD